tara:strand:- start:9190 stop:9459 length:270 start_codon:yes stop_codon:yes gene_type:complete
MLTSNSFNGKGAEQSAPLKLMKIKTNRDMRIDGEFVSSGSTVEVNDKDARYLIANNLASETTAKSKSKKSNKSEGLDVSDAKVGTRDES